MSLRNAVGFVRKTITATKGFFGDLKGDVIGNVSPISYSIATLPDAVDNSGKIVTCSDGDAGSACLAFSDGTDWLRIALGAAVAAS